MSADQAPLYPVAVILPILAFGSWILCIPPLIWHFSQRNIAAGSLILWIIMTNFFDSVNPLIWPRDNITEWWDGKIWCDINVRIQIGGTVGMAASVTMIVRKLARVMDTRNITMSTSRNNKKKEMILDMLVCWGYPLVLIIVYYAVQPMRYLIYGIVGCWSAYHTSWPSVVLSYMWGPITMCVAAYYAGLLLYRLYRYRREFNRLVAARNTTKSRFVRLFVICIVIILFYLPYTFYLLSILIPEITDPYDWKSVHGPNFNSIIMIPVFGQVFLDKWGQVASGYVIFLVFGTGTDAHNTYRKMLLAVGLGRIFPSLHHMRESGASTPSSFIAARTWSSAMGNKAKSYFVRPGSITETYDGSTRNDSIAMPSLASVSTETPILQRRTNRASSMSFFKRIICRRGSNGPILPLFSDHSTAKTIHVETEMEKSRPESISPGVYAHAWASDSRRPLSEPVGVHVVREIHQARHERSESGQVRNSADAWT
ncbi:STE3-domain-containing protein [Dothidotthia symphoricarpi CBS 119687]|uniref:STE3-domain-containing protein n=1 Tax=Dothidotthia symphoricarpi CBS 119687 TaxID=1392245 RepID=A0A6A6A9W0_9PLEO|nr:STE3-domain-containing protein [Dothidotthia symphoricarpi CBS 119687]KAF2128356.1 STE3-domain-containing protein [Dothidotthia symphoricarpi CBS 119687]